MSQNRKGDHEFTLEDTYDHLKDIQTEMHEMMERSLNDICDANNGVQTLPLPPTITSKDLQEKEQRLKQKLLKHNHKYDHRMSPLCQTTDAEKSTIWELEQEVSSVKKMFDKLKVEILDAKNSIVCSENETIGLEKMKETCVDAIEKCTGGIINNEEASEAKKLFNKVKEDLATTVETIFPEHNDFKEILMELTTAYMKGGDQVYVNFNTKYVDCIKFMIEADIATYHRNDKNKIRLVDLL